MTMFILYRVGVAQGEDAVNSKRGRGIQFEFPGKIYITKRNNPLDH